MSSINKGKSMPKKLTLDMLKAWLTDIFTKKTEFLSKTNYK
jgi:hypothetical protein